MRIELLGRKAPLVLALRELGSLPPDQRGPRGKVLNQVRQSLEQALERVSPSWTRPSWTSGCGATGST